MCKLLCVHMCEYELQQILRKSERERDEEKERETYKVHEILARYETSSRKAQLAKSYSFM